MECGHRYTTTAACFANRLAGAPPVRRGNGTVGTDDRTGEGLQSLMIATASTPVKRTVVLAGDAWCGQQAQLKVRLPADGYPSQELIDACAAGVSAATR
jgi:hypothetical protein